MSPGQMLEANGLEPDTRTLAAARRLLVPAPERRDESVENPVLYREIGQRTGGDIYIGVVGPVRSGKSTFIKQFMEELVLPALTDPAAKTRARDELPSRRRAGPS